MTTYPQLTGVLLVHAGLLRPDAKGRPLSVTVSPRSSEQHCSHPFNRISFKASKLLDARSHVLELYVGVGVSAYVRFVLHMGTWSVVGLASQSLKERKDLSSKGMVRGTGAIGVESFEPVSDLRWSRSQCEGRHTCTALSQWMPWFKGNTHPVSRIECCFLSSNHARMSTERLGRLLLSHARGVLTAMRNEALQG